MAISCAHIGDGASGYFAHNSRERETKNSIFNDEQNYCSTNAKEAFEVYRFELGKRTQAYLDNHPTRKKLHAKTVTHLSAIVNFNKEHTPQDIKRVCNYLEEKYDTKVIQYSMHRDEGYIAYFDENELHGTQGIKNYHAHIEFIGLSSNGQSIKRRIGKPELKQLQTDVANILGMERGARSGYSKKEYKEIQAIVGNPAEYQTKQEYNKKFNEAAKDLGYIKERKKPKKRLDTYEYKYYKQEETKQILAKQKDLNQKIKQLEAELQQSGAERKERNTDLENNQLSSENKYLQDKNIQLERSINALESKNNKIIASQPNMDELRDQAKEYVQNELDVKITTEKFSFMGLIKTLVLRYKQAKQKITDLLKENEELKQENKKLKYEEQESQESDRIKELRVKLENETIPMARELIQAEIDELKEQEALKTTSAIRRYK